MRWFWVIACDNTVENPLVTTAGDLGGADESLFRKGRTIDDWQIDAWVGARTPADDGDPDDVLQNHLGLPIYSRRLRSALEESGIDELQYLPLRVLRSDGTEIPGFSIVNTLTLLPALDLAKSDYDVFPSDYFPPQRRGLIRGIRQPTLLRNALKGHHVMRLRDFPYALYASDHFRSTFEKGGFTGYSFRPVPISEAT